MIDTVPLPEKSLSVDIPVRLLKEFKEDIRVVYKDQWIWGIPVPEFFLMNLVNDKVLLKEISERFDLMLVPK